MPSMWDSLPQVLRLTCTSERFKQEKLNVLSIMIVVTFKQHSRYIFQSSFKLIVKVFLDSLGVKSEVIKLISHELVTMKQSRLMNIMYLVRVIV